MRINVLLLFKIVQYHVFSVPYSIGALLYPFSEDEEMCMAGEHEVKFNMAVAKDKIGGVGVVL